MGTHRSASLRVHLGKSNATWTLVLRTGRGREEWDRRLDMGMLAYEGTGTGPHDLIPLLERAVADLKRRHSIDAPAKRSAPPPGATGGDEPYPADRAQLRLVQPVGQPLDEP